MEQYIFVNLSNHPSQKWDTDQREAAQKYGDIVDLPFPVVPPDHDENDISKLAEECISRIMSLEGNIVCAMVQGEFTLTFAIVKRLIQQGIEVVSACSERNTIERTDENGEIIRETRFKFVRFRRYE
ncbi:MAG: hypothetical protein J6Y89_03200 [Lachnospiraceae bacterium]|nr:hypothetical protein [Lachnospiraceae bacterium]